MASRDKSTDGATAEKNDRWIKPPVKTAIYISAESARKLKLAALLEGKTQGELIEPLLVAHLSGYYGGKRNGATAGAGAGGQSGTSTEAGQ